MEMELEPRVKPLPYKVKATSRESNPQKAAHVLDPDLRTHWSTGTNTKEWILLELDEPCLLSHLRIYNKSVLEWEITVGLRYKPEAFVKVRPRCEAPRRDMMYPMNYTPCRYVRISCLRGNPIAIYFIQLIGVSVNGLEPEFQPVVNYLLPHIISHKQEAHDMYFQFLQDMTSRLQFFLPQLETDLANFTDEAEFNIRFFAMLTGPFYPILQIVKERESAKALLSIPDSDAFKGSQTSATLTVSSNFEAQPRRTRSPSPFIQHTTCSIAFRSDAILMLLKKAYRDSHLGTVCCTASRALYRLVEPITSQEESVPSSDLSLSSNSDESTKSEVLSNVQLSDYSSLFGEAFKIPDASWDATYLNILDIAAVEEGIIHVLYACASQPPLCLKLADYNSDFWSILPLVQALLPALRPPINSPVQVDDAFSQWKHSSVQHALSQIVSMSSSTVYRPLLRACAGYLSSFSSSHAKAACVLIDLCCGPFSPWIATVIAKVDLATELMEDLLQVIQGASIVRARAALKYIILALSGHMDDVLANYKENKHKLLFLLEMLEPFLDPAMTATRSAIVFGDDSTTALEKQERSCAFALNLVRTAAQRPAVLPSLESEWRSGSVAPSVLLSILGPQIPLPPDIDLCKCSTSKVADQESCNIASGPHLHSHEFSSKFSSPGESDEKIEMLEPTVKVDANDDANLLFAPPELKKTVLISHSNHFMWNNPDRGLETGHGNTEGMEDNTIHRLPLDNSVFVEFFNLQADYMQLVDHQDCALRSSEFQRLAQDLCSQHDITPEGHDAAIDALLLAAECYVNPFFMVSFRPASYLMDRLKPASKLMDQLNSIKSNTNKNGDVMELGRKSQNKKIGIEKIAHMEAKRDKAVLCILLQAAKLNVECQVHKSQGEMYPNDSNSGEQDIDIHSLDLHSADAVTIVRRNQALLCNFIVQRLQREQHLSHEILLQSLLFLLHSATELFCPPESVIGIIIQSAEDLNGMFTSLYHQIKEGNMHLDMENSRVLQRRWVLLQRLVLASSGSGEVTNSVSNRTNRFQYRCLVPPSSWMQKISKFSNNTYPLPRYLGWMAISRYAKLYLKERLFFASDLSQLTSLLTVFTDELALVDKVAEQKLKASDRQLPVNKQYSDESGGDESLCVLYPDLHKFFPNMKEQFGSFGEIILEAVGLQLKCLPSSAVPDLLCWFSDLCMWPFSGTGNSHHTIEKFSNSLKGYSSIHAKVIVLYLLESIVSEHMEAMVPEMPRVAQILISLCSASYCDVAFLESALGLLQPLISYFLRKVTDDVKLFSDDLSSLDFELIFEQLFDSIKCRNRCQDVPGGKKARGSLMIFVLGTLFPDFSSRRKIEILQSLLEWVDFTASDPTSSYYDYLCAFHKVMKSCHMLLLQNLNLFDILKPFKKSAVSEHNIGILDSCSYFLKGYTNCSETEEIDGTVAYDLSDQGFHQLSADVKEFSEDLELLISKLSTAIEISWELHPQLAKKLTCISAKCFLFARCLCSISQEGTIATSGDDGSLTLSKSNELLSKYWQNALEGLTSLIVTIQQNQCWEVGSAMLDYLLRLPQTISLDCVLCSICSVIKHFFLHAPCILWRLQTDKWLSYLFMRGIANGNEVSVLDLFSSMLSHWEPEQRSVALQHLGRIVCLDNNDGVARLSNSSCDNFFASDSTIVVPESIVSALVTSTWDRVAVVALSDPCMLLRSHAMALLSGYIPFADRAKLQSFLVATNTFMRSMGRLSPSMEECHVTRLSLNLLASACLYSPPEDIALIPESVWRNLEDIGMSKTGGLNDGDKKLCQALCKLKAEPHGAKEALQDVLSSSYFTKQSDPNFSSTRESILQVLSSLTSIQSYFDFFSRKTDEVSQELEEAEIEMDLLQKEKALQEVSRSSPEEISVLPSSVSHDKEDNSRLQKIKDGIQFLERSKHREEIVARRQKKLLMRRARQKYLEEVASREMELLQEIDRERTNEMERTIERQKQLELERAKTRELQFNLDIERERQTQRELQRELEQVESGFRSSRREYSSNPTSRPRERERERFRERDNVRSGNEGSLRPSSRGRESATSQTATSPLPTVVLAGSRSFSGQLPTILQSRERIEERGGAAYEDNFEGSRDSGDASSMGDPELASAFDGLPAGFGPVPRSGSRGSKSRPVGDRREKEGRREGKWERKH